MGLDLALSAVILFAAIRGWLRGFVSQAIRLSGFVGCFYLADPVRDQARPYVLTRLPKVDPALMDRILWWASAVVAYVVVVGVATLAIKMMRRPDVSGKPEARRDDQFAGFLFGAAKGALVAVFLTAAVQKYGIEAAKKMQLEWAGKQVENSKALVWNQKYQPVPKIWESPPVRRFVEHIQRNGLSPVPVDATAAPDEVAELRPDDGSRRPPRLDLSPLGQADSNAELDLDREVAEDLERIKAERDARREAEDWR
ncbi:CvpA family protein [Paludisphaera borealis]|uniref:Colicin V production protein n=1 Tax=Paludisphaera borealis TaxID=1387353 RepID=A0A1U7CYB5_9BACT|nr:CvpA family protein [Paludisphaera borealis]APW63869.1 hypothetical protein BSF38_05453 [Paludisphaera borealis]